MAGGDMPLAIGDCGSGTVEVIVLAEATEFN